MSKLSLGLAASAALVVLATSADSNAQNLSNRCLTPQFWCWLPSYAPVGASCYCGTPYGPVWGRVG